MYLSNPEGIVLFDLKAFLPPYNPKHEKKKRVILLIEGSNRKETRPGALDLFFHRHLLCNILLKTGKITSILS
jgi:hypothetical protein